MSLYRYLYRLYESYRVYGLYLCLRSEVVGKHASSPSVRKQRQHGDGKCLRSAFPKNGDVSRAITLRAHFVTLTGSTVRCVESRNNLSESRARRSLPPSDCEDLRASRSVCNFYPCNNPLRRP